MYSFDIKKELSIYADVTTTFPQWMENCKKDKGDTIDETTFKLLVTKNYIELKSDQFVIFMETLNTFILELIKASVANDVLRGLKHITALLEMCSIIPDSVLQYQEMVQMALRNPSILVVEEATLTLCLISNSLKQSAFCRRQIANEIMKALESFHAETTSASAKVNACTTLKIILEKVPQAVSTVESDCFTENLWLLLSDSATDSLRLVAAQILALFIRSLTDKREYNASTFGRVFLKVKHNLLQGDSMINGSLLALLSLLRAVDGSYFSRHFKELCVAVLSLKGNNVNGRIVLLIIPLLAQLDPVTFCSLHLKEIVDRLLALLKGEEWLAMLAIAQLANIYKKPILFSDALMSHAINSCLDHLVPLFRERSEHELTMPAKTMIFDALNLVVPVLHVRFLPKIRALIEVLDFTDFCPTAKRFLLAARDAWPSSLDLPVTHYILTLMQNLIVEGRECAVAISGTGQMNYAIAFGESGYALCGYELDDCNKVSPTALFISLIKHFSFGLNSLKPILETLATQHLLSNNPATRQFAIEAIVTFVATAQSRYRSLLYFNILYVLFTRILTEDLKSLRLLILHSFKERPSFEKYLIQHEFLKVLFLLLNDESFEIQELTILILGRIYAKNMAVIGPRIRVLLIEYLAKVKLTEEHEKEIVPHMIGRLFKYFPKLLQSYTGPIIEILVKTIHHPSYSTIGTPSSGLMHTHSYFLTCNCISAIGYLILEGTVETQTVKSLLLLIIQNYQDLSSTYKRETALESLRKIIVRTGYSVNPLEVYPPLLDLVLESIMTAPEAMRLKLVHFLGTIGAVDPHQYKLLHLDLLENFDKKPIGSHHGTAGATGIIGKPNTTSNPANPSAAGNNPSAGSASGTLSTSGATGGASGNTTARLMGQIEGEIVTKVRRDIPVRLKEQDSAMKEMLRELSVQSDDYYPAKVLELLMEYLSAPYLTSHSHLHIEVVEIVMVILRGMGTACLPYFQHFINPLIDVIQVEGPNSVGIREIFFKQLKILVSMLSHYSLDYLELLIGLMEEYWKFSYLQVIIIDLLVELEVVTPTSSDSKCFTKFLPRILQSIISTNDQLVVKTLESLKFFGTTLDPYLHLLFPLLIDLVGNPNVLIVNTALTTINHLTCAHDIGTYSLKLIRKLIALIRPLEANGPDRALLSNYISTLCYTIGSITSYSSRTTYFEMVEPVVLKKNLEHSLFTMLRNRVKGITTSSHSPTQPSGTQPSPGGVASALQGQATGFSSATARRIESNQVVGVMSHSNSLQDLLSDQSLMTELHTKLLGTPQPGSGSQSPTMAPQGHPWADAFDAQSFLGMWDVSSIASDTEWWEWLRTVSIMMLRGSPASALRCVGDLAAKNDQIAYGLFNVAFLSCWSQTKGALAQSQFITNFENVLSSPTIASKVLHILLDLVEFMERTERALPLDINKLGFLAQKSHAFAKALYYMEKSYKQNPRSMVDALITINNYLESHEAASGVLVVAKDVYNMTVDISWYEKLQKWRMCIEKYEAKQREEPNDPSVSLGIMRCLANLGSWRELKQQVQHYQSIVGANNLAHINNSNSLSGNAPFMPSAPPPSGKPSPPSSMLLLQPLGSVGAQGAGQQRNNLLVGGGSRLPLAQMSSLISSASTSNVATATQSAFNRGQMLLQPPPLQPRSGALKQLRDSSSGTSLSTQSDASVVALFLTNAAFNLGQFELLPGYIVDLEENSVKRLFYEAVISVYNDEFVKARAFIEKARVAITPTLIAMLGESYSRAYETIVRVQQLTELEEIIAYKQFRSEDARRTMREMWRRRLTVIAQNVEAWQDVLSVRALVLPKKTEAEQWVQYSHIVKKNNRFRRATKILEDLIVEMSGIKDPFPTIPDSVDPMVRHSYLELISNIPEMATQAYNEMVRWVSSFRVQNVPTTIQAKCYLNLCEWDLQSHNELNETIISSLLSNCKAAMQCDEKWFKVWHVWAIVNYRILVHYSKEQTTSHKIFDHLLPAVTGFIRCIALSPSNRQTIQDTLRLITLWFNYGYKKDIEKALKEGFEMINIDTWLPVIPQIIARIHTSSFRSGIDQLLQAMGQKHPMALMFPITVAFKSEIRSRKQAALNLLNNMRQHSPKLVQETLLVSCELIRVAILWKEKWRKGLDEAYHQYYYERNVNTMMSVLLPLHELLNSGVKTPNEMAFQKAFGKDLEKAWNCCKDFARTHNESCLHLAWDLYSHVFRIVKRQLQTDFEKVHLSLISPELSALENLELAIPGTYVTSYRSKQPIVTIQRFGAVLKVIPSKQRPRKLMVYGSDGNEYPFLLKGDEDLRQDERAMQLFGLVNTLLDADDGAQKRHLGIQTFSIVPLSSDSGLITWLSHCDTLHELIKAYRHSHKISLEAELSYIQRIVSREEYHQLMPTQKLEVFEYALEQTKGDDLQQILWLNSQNAESWLEKRTTYTRSLAVMSMVGYILGLGDRHPNNIMFNRNSGKIIHIDFGDCFEVAMKREKFPERVPFRLTRMLVSAMEVSGVEGNFRISCKNTLGVLIENKESIMAVLEAFVYDPLINWDQTKRRNIADDLSEVLKDTNAVKSNALDPLLYGSGMPNVASPSFHPTQANSAFPNQRGQLPQGAQGNALQMPPINTASISQANDSASYLMDASKGQPTQNKKALTVLDRIAHKLNQTEFEHLGKLTVERQVDLLIDQARSNLTLCQSYLPWCPYW